MAAETPTTDMMKPRTDLTTTVGKEVVVYFRLLEELAPLDLPLESNKTLRCRLVGFDRQGIWVEPQAWLDKALKDNNEVNHVFLHWDHVLSIVREHKTETFVSKREYRGLRPADR